MSVLFTHMNRYQRESNDQAGDIINLHHLSKGIARASFKFIPCLYVVTMEDIYFSRRNVVVSKFAVVLKKYVNAEASHCEHVCSSK